MDRLHRDGIARSEPFPILFSQDDDESQESFQEAIDRHAFRGMIKWIVQDDLHSGRAFLDSADDHEMAFPLFPIREKELVYRCDYVELVFEMGSDRLNETIRRDPVDAS